MTQIILEDSEYTFDASAKTVTLGAPYTGLSVGQIISIIDLKTNDVLYDSNTQRTDAISISGAVITHTHGNTGQADADELQIVIDAGSLNSGTSTSNAAHTQNTRLNPDWAHISNEQPFNAQAADGSSTGYDVSSYKSLGFRLTDAICDGVLTITDSDGAPLMFTVDGILKSSHTCPASGTNKHTCKIVNGNPDQTIFVLTGRTTGSITIDTLYQ